MTLHLPIPHAFDALSTADLTRGAEFIEPPFRDFPGRISYCLGQLAFVQDRVADSREAWHSLATLPFWQAAKDAYTIERMDHADAVIALIRQRGAGR